MKKLKELKEDYKNGMMSKSDFISGMHEIHTYLFEYSNLLKETDVSKIEITDDSVIMTLRDSGIKMICDKDDKRIITIEILNFNSFEKEELKCVTKMLNPGSTVLDIGANIGFYSLNLFKEFNNIRILAFEPVPKTYNYLKINLQLNNCTGVEAFNFGFSDEHKNIDIYLNPECSGNSSLANLVGSSTSQKVNCKFTTVDMFTAENNIKVDFIKCDVEGAELLVFKGARNILKQHKPVVYTEMLRKWSAKFNYHPNEIISLFKDLGYLCFTLKEDKLVSFTTMDENTLETNFFFLHEKNHASQISLLS